ncbi:hypothetical protein FQZ97_979880 [compost metagenome]
MAEPFGFCDRVVHQPRTDTTARSRWINCKWTKQQSWNRKTESIKPGLDIPQAHRACQRTIRANSGKSQTFRRQATTAQLFRRFSATAFAHSAIKQSFARDSVLHSFDRNGESRRKKRRQAGYDIFLNFQISVHDISPQAWVAAHPAQR